MSEPGTSYRNAGVDIDLSQRTLRDITSAIESTYSERVVSGVGGFGSLFQGSFPDLERPLLACTIDGVGTKTKVAAMVGDYSNIGADIVNHCANDILCQGARPLFFVDYFGCSQLSPLQFNQVVGSAADACAALGCALIGGETAEMPGVYHDEEIDVVGCMTGIVDASQKLPRGKMSAGDLVIGISSNGLHTNGYTLARRALFETGHYSVGDEVPGLGTTIGEELLRPHRCYTASVLPLLQEVPEIYAVAHITGGGLFDNPPRVMRSDVRLVIDRRSWTPPPIFSMIQNAGDVDTQEMFRVFNMGIGMILFVGREVASAVVHRLNQSGESSAVIGEVQSGPTDVQIA